MFKFIRNCQFSKVVLSFYILGHIQNCLKFRSNNSAFVTSLIPYHALFSERISSVVTSRLQRTERSWTGDLSFSFIVAVVHSSYKICHSRLASQYKSHSYTHLKHQPSLTTKKSLCPDLHIHFTFFYLKFYYPTMHS